MARLIVIFFAYDKVTDNLKQSIEGFFYLYSLAFKKLYTEQFDVKNPFLDAFKPTMSLLATEDYINKNVIDFEKMVSFFTGFIAEEQDELIVFASSQ